MDSPRLTQNLLRAYLFPTASNPHLPRRTQKLLRGFHLWKLCLIRNHRYAHNGKLFSFSRLSLFVLIFIKHSSSLAHFQWESDQLIFITDVSKVFVILRLWGSRARSRASSNCFRFGNVPINLEPSCNFNILCIALVIPYLSFWDETPNINWIGTEPGINIVRL